MLCVVQKGGIYQEDVRLTKWQTKGTGGAEECELFIVGNKYVSVFLVLWVF